MDVVLETARLVLRRFTEADVDRLVDLDSDPEVMRYLSGGPSAPRDVIQRDILPWVLGSYHRFPGFGVWAAIEKASGDFLGWFSFKPRDDDCRKDVELGYRLRRAVWGQGVRDRRRAGADHEGLHRARRAARLCHDVSGQPRLPSRDGKGGADAGADVSPHSCGPRGCGYLPNRV